jgi:siderophore synthetase component
MSGIVATTGPTAVRAVQAEAELAEHEPDLVPLLRAHLPHAMDVVARRLVAAVIQEGLPGAGQPPARVQRHGFGRADAIETVPGDPARLLDILTDVQAPGLQAELSDACVHLALALARRSTVDPGLVDTARRRGAADMIELTDGMAADERCVAFERLGTLGHNLHPCGRTRLGWGIDDALAHDLESPVTSVEFLAVRRDLHLGDAVAADLLGDGELSAAMARAGVDPACYVVTPVHPWQRRHVLSGRYADLAADRALVPLDVAVPALVTAALRTLYVPAAGCYLKLSLDIQVTSTRRTISVASTRNGPALSTLLPGLIADDRVLLLAETAGSAVVVPGPPQRDRDLAAIVRSGLSGRLAPAEVMVPGLALPARDPVTGGTVLASLVDRFARTRGVAASPDAAQRFVAEYARLLLPPMLRLATQYGIGLEAHLQNCLPTFVAGVPTRMAVRDLAGMRIHTGRLATSLAAPPTLWPGSATVTDDENVLRAKVCYTALQAHLGEIVVQLVGSHGLDEARAWTTVRSTVDETYAALADEPGPASRPARSRIADRARADHAFLTAPAVPHKALLRMRLSPDGGDQYIDVPNALAGVW